MYHLRDISLYSRCPRLFYLDRQGGQKPRYLSYLRNPLSIPELVKGKFGIKELFIGMPNQQSSVFWQAQDKYSWFYNTRFEREGLRVKVPLLNRLDDGSFDLYFIILLPNPIAHESIYYHQTYRMLCDEGVPIANVYLLHLNPDYLRQEELDIPKALSISEYFYNDKHQEKENVKEWVSKKSYDNGPKLLELENCLRQKMPEVIAKEKCLKYPRCDYYSYCYPNEPDREVFLSGSAIAYAQRQATKREFVDKPALRNWLEMSCSYPLSFLDFEWDTFSVPPYFNMKALDSIPFQYSLEVGYKNGEYKHYDFLETGDTRKNFLDSLLRDLPKEGSILVFNAEGGEKLHLLELKRQFPDYGEKIDGLIERMVDIADVFNNGSVFVTGMANSLSLKSIAKAIDGQSYKDLMIIDGRDTVMKWRSYEKRPSEQLKKALLSYCNSDSISLVKIYEYLQVISKD